MKDGLNLINKYGGTDQKEEEKKRNDMINKEHQREFNKKEAERKQYEKIERANKKAKGLPVPKVKKDSKIPKPKKIKNEDEDKHKLAQINADISIEKNHLKDLVMNQGQTVTSGENTNFGVGPNFMNTLWENIKGDMIPLIKKLEHGGMGEQTLAQDKMDKKFPNGLGNAAHHFFAQTASSGSTETMWKNVGHKKYCMVNQLA